MSTALTTFQSALTNLYEKPYCTGAVDLTTKTSTLFYKSADSVAGLIDFADPTDVQLESLANACQPATFGLNQEDVLDETYRKAGKMDVGKFATNFSPLDLGIVDAIRDTLLRDKNAGRAIRTELYKLNVYGPGAFFKSHVDTPRSETMFGSLVVLLPTAHFRLHERCHLSHFASRRLRAFFSDGEHEVSPVTKGYRVTLTYNLYFAEDDTQTSVQPEPPASDADEIAKEALVRLLQDPSFLPEGGFLGFGLAHKYPISLTVNHGWGSSTELKPFLERLKATDAAFKRICDAASLSTSLKCAYQINESSGSYCLVDKLVSFEGQGTCDEGIAGYLVAREKGVLVDDENELSCYQEGSDTWYSQFKPIVWAKNMAFTNEFAALFVAYGNEANLNREYGDMCLVASILPAEQRDSH